MKNKDLEKFLLKNGFENVGGDNEGEMYDSDHVTVFLDSNDPKRSVSFGHSSDGYYNIKNATEEQIETIISIFKCAEFIPCSEECIPKERFKVAFAEILKNFYLY